MKELHQIVLKNVGQQIRDANKDLCVCNQGYCLTDPHTQRVCFFDTSRGHFQDQEPIITESNPFDITICRRSSR